MHLVTLALASLAAAALAAPPAQAGIAFDNTEDFLPTYAGESRAGLDVLLALAVTNGSFLQLGTIQAGPIVADDVFVWGVDRGAGTEGLFAGDPPVGPGTFFDAVIVLRGDGTGAVTTLDGGAPVTTALDAALIELTGELIAVAVPTWLLPSTGFTLSNYSVNLWTRGGGGNVGIADLASDHGNFDVTAVPEPASWALLIAGFGLVGGVARRAKAMAEA